MASHQDIANVNRFFGDEFELGGWVKYELHDSCINCHHLHLPCCALLSQNRKWMFKGEKLFARIMVTLAQIDICCLCAGSSGRKHEISFSILPNFCNSENGNFNGNVRREIVDVCNGGPEMDFQFGGFKGWGEWSGPKVFRLYCLILQLHLLPIENVHKPWCHRNIRKLRTTTLNTCVSPGWKLAVDN